MPAVAVTRERVDVVATLLPVATTIRKMVGDLDALEPLEGLVAVHRRNIETDGPAVVRAQLRPFHRVRDEHVVTARLLEAQRLRVRPVEAVEDEVRRGRLDTDAVEDLAQPHA